MKNRKGETMKLIDKIKKRLNPHWNCVSLLDHGLEESVWYSDRAKLEGDLLEANQRLTKHGQEMKSIFDALAKSHATLVKDVAWTVMFRPRLNTRRSSVFQDLLEKPCGVQLITGIVKEVSLGDWLWNPAEPCLFRYYQSWQDLKTLEQEIGYVTALLQNRVAEILRIRDNISTLEILRLEQEREKER